MFFRMIVLFWRLRLIQYLVIIIVFLRLNFLLNTMKSVRNVYFLRFLAVLIILLKGCILVRSSLRLIWRVLNVKWRSFVIIKVFSVFDSAVGAYLQPFFAQSKGAAIRSFTDAANESGHLFARHAGDYILFELGEYDDADASFKLLPAPQSLGVASEFVRRPDGPPDLRSVAS